MEYNNYEIDIKLNNSTIEVEPKNFSFTMTDNINELFPTLTINFNDFTGQGQEYLAFAEGIPLEITFGFDTDFIKNKYVIVKDKLTQLQNPSNINGVVSIQAIHDYHFNQEIKSLSYKKSISDIVTELCNNYRFKSTNIDSTGNNTTWYQMLLTDADFMEGILLPNAYSPNALNSPFYLFIDNDNTANLRSYASMINSTPVTTFEFNQENSKEAKQSTVLDVQRYRGSGLDYDDLKNRFVFKHNEDTGKTEQEQDTISDYPNIKRKYLPSLSTTSVKSFIDIGDSSTDSGKKDSLEGRKINSMKNSMSLDYLTIASFLDTNIRAGSTVKVRIPVAGSDSNADDSVYFTDNYLVEKSKHSWNSQTGTSTFFLSRKGVTLTNDYLIKDKLFKS